MKNIVIKVEPSQLKDTASITLEDLSISEMEWRKMDNEQKKEMLQDYINDLPEQPYWVIDKYID